MGWQRTCRDARVRCAMVARPLACCRTRVCVGGPQSGVPRGDIARRRS
jgi:hypothetical protein